MSEECSPFTADLDGGGVENRADLHRRGRSNVIGGNLSGTTTMEDSVPAGQRQLRRDRVSDMMAPHHETSVAIINNI